jgi:hypothetical protein
VAGRLEEDLEVERGEAKTLTRANDKEGAPTQ